MPTRPCPGPSPGAPCPTRALVTATRGTKQPACCPPCRTARQRAKDAHRPQRRSHAEQERRRQQVRDQPWCTVCGATEDLTAGHLGDVAAGYPESGPLTTLCRHHNSSSGATVRRAGRR